MKYPNEAVLFRVVKDEFLTDTVVELTCDDAGTVGRWGHYLRVHEALSADARFDCVSPHLLKPLTKSAREFLDAIYVPDRDFMDYVINGLLEGT